MRSKAILLIAFLACITHNLSAQEWDGQGTQFNAESILRNQVVLPSSPEAASLGKFGHIPISPFTGSPQINIPLYQINGRYLPWSVSLSYDVHAVKVDEVPSWTGLGWTLNGPGVITRSVVGDPDLKRNYFSPVQDLPAGADENILEFQNPDQIIENNFLVSLINGSIEAQPDMFFFNFGGYSGKFVITRSKVLVYYEFSGMTIIPEFDNVTDNIIRFTAYDPEGRKYVFDRVEYTIYHNPNEGSTEPRATDAFLYQFNSSWYLSEVESPGGEEKLIFDYHTLSGPYTAPVNIHLNEYRVKSGDQFDTEHCGSPQVSLVTQTPSQMQIYDRRLLKSIRLESPEGGVREELSFAIQSTGGLYPDFKLVDITLKKRWQETPLMTVSRTTLGYDNSTGRLTLKSVLEEGIDPNGQALAKPPYSLTYDAGQLPPIGSGNIDHWGYNNACGSSLIPAALDCNSGQDIVGQGGANRESNEDAMKEGTLTGITYPTGGRTQWEWEANRVHGRPCVGASPVVGGVRIKTITDYTGGSQISQRRTYRYVTTGAGGPEISSGLLFSEPFYYMSTSYHNEPPPGVSYDDPPPPWSEDYTCYSIYVYPTSLGVLGAVQGSHVGYSRVEEIIGTVQDNIGKNVYYYHTEPISEATQFTTHANGDLIKKEVYDKDGVLVRKEELLYSYQSGETANSATAVNLKAESWQAQSSETLLCQTSENPLQFEWRVVGGQYSPSCLASKRFKSKYKRKAFFFKQIWKYVSEKTATDYFYENGVQSTVVKRLSYVYGDQTVNLPTEQYFTNSDGVEHRLETRYHKWMFIKGIPEEITYKVGGAVVGGQLLTFQAGKPLNFYEKLKGGGTLLRGQISAYTAGGSPQDFTWMAFPTDDFLWENGLMTRRDKLDWHWHWQYNERRLLTGATDIDGQQLAFGYDALDRLQTSSARQGNIVATYVYEYGTPNRITQTTTYTDAPTQTMVQTFDGLGRPTNMRHNNVLKKEWIYDAYGRLEKETYLPGNLMTYIYDDSPLNRVIQVIYPDNSETETRYGAQNNYYKTTVLDEKENETQTFTDLLGRTRKIIDAHGGQTLYTYDASGNLERVDPPIGEPYEYRYDIRNRMTSKDVPGAETQHLRYYDQTDLLKFTVDGNRNRLDYAYDAYGREREVRLAAGVNINPDQEQFGAPGDLIRDNTYGEALGGINVGKLTQSRAKMLDGTANFVANNYSYDPFGRMTGQLDNYTLGGVNFSDSWLFSFNHADWQTAIARKHNRGAQALDVVATMAHDNFGREIMYIFGSVPGDAMAVTRAFNDRDELIQKQYGSLGSGSYLEKTVFRYTPRGWIEEMNPVVARKDDWTYCSRPSQPPSPGGVHEEAQVSLDELLDRIAAGEQVSVNDLDPCENGECYERLYTWEVSYDLWRSANNAIMQIRAAGQTLPLPNYNYEIADSLQLRADLGAWLTANGYVYAGIDFEVEGGQTPTGAPTWRGTIRIRRTNLTFEYIRDLQGIPYSFKRFDLSFEPCKNIKDRPIGEAAAQATSVAALDAQMPALTPATMTFPTLLYKVYLPGIGVRWVAREELPTLEGPYQRLGRVHIGSNQQTFQVKRTDGSSATLNLAQMLSERAQGLLDDISPKEETNNSEECNLQPLGCTPYEIQQQNSSVTSIMGQMAQLNAAGLSFPITLYLVQLCDGSTIYILGQNLLSQLLGPHIVLDQLLITGPDQLISVTVIRKDPLFAMEFDYELNGNIEEARWKVTRHNPKYYRYGYDGLNRVTVADYGDILLTENPVNGALNLQILETNTYRGWNYAYDAIGNLERLSRNGFIGGPTCEWGMIDDLTYSYDAQRAHLTGVADAAPLPGRDKGFKPKPGAGAYLYDANGNMTFDPHKDITISYNFLNLPSQIVKTGAGGGTISLTYDAAGRKWRKQVTGVTKDYCQGIEYKDGKVEAVYGQEGRLTAVYDQYGVTLTSFRAEYWLKDHLGNTRIAFADENHNGTIEVWDDPSTPENEAEITQENHYYPFGMNQEGPWYATIGPRNGYQYNGKELNEELELGWNDFGARWQDPATGRWWQVDPLGDRYVNISPYAYVADNPVVFIDPDGRYIDIEYIDDDGKTQYYRYGSGVEITNDFVKSVVNTLDKLVADNLDVQGVITQLANDDSATFISQTSWNDHNNSVVIGNGGQVNWSPEGGIVTDEGNNRSPAVGLLHELGHIYYEKYNPEGLPSEPNYNDFDTDDQFNKAFDQYENTLNTAAGTYDNPSDKWIIEQVENPASQRLGQPTRSFHSYKRKYRALSPFSTQEKSN